MYQVTAGALDWIEHAVVQDGEIPNPVRARKKRFWKI
jgi:hypothetical protein